MAIPVTNGHGRPWDELDAIRAHMAARAQAGGASYAVLAECGAPLCGRHVPGRELVTLVARGWAKKTPH